MSIKIVVFNCSVRCSPFNYMTLMRDYVYITSRQMLKVLYHLEAKILLRIPDAGETMVSLTRQERRAV